MKKTVLALAAISALVLLVGCDPLGSTETRAYITGTIYTDKAMTIPAEGVSVELVVDPDSSAFASQTVLTNTAGVFFMEIDFYPSMPDDESGMGYTLPSSGKAGLTAHYGVLNYTYKSVDDGFIIEVGDTLTVWDVAVEDFVGGSE